MSDDWTPTQEQAIEELDSTTSAPNATSHATSLPELRMRTRNYAHP